VAYPTDCRSARPRTVRLQADGQPAPAQWQVAGKISVLMHRYMRPKENVSHPEKFLTWKKFTYINGTSSVQTNIPM